MAGMTSFLEADSIVKEQKRIDRHDYPVVTMIGSTKFKDEFERVAKELELKGYIVIKPHTFMHVDDDPRIRSRKYIIDDMWRKAIRMADIVYIVDVDGYMGESTAKEQDYAIGIGRQIIYHSAGGYSDLAHTS